jgi:hypothetical protein
MTIPTTGDLTVTDIPANAAPPTDHPALPAPPPAPDPLPALTWDQQQPPPPMPTPAPTLQTVPWA